METIERLRKKAEVFQKDNIPLHVTTNSDTWLNGYVVKVYDDYFILLDREDGEVPVFYVDIRVFDFYKGDIERLKKVEGVTNGNKLL